MSNMRCPCGAEYDLDVLWVDVPSSHRTVTATGDVRWSADKWFIDLCAGCGREVNGYGVAALTRQTRQTWLEEASE